MEVLVEVLMVIFVKRNEGGGGGEKLLLLSFGFGLSFDLFNLFLIAKSISDGLGAFFISSLAISFFSTSSFFSKEPTIRFSASND